MWSSGRRFGSGSSAGAAGQSFFRTLETPGALAPDASPPPWSLQPGLPAGPRVEQVHFIGSGFQLQLSRPDGTMAFLRCASTAPGRIAGETDLVEARPFLFSPTYEVTEEGPCWQVRTPDQAVVLVREEREGLLRYALISGAGEPDELRVEAEALLGTSLAALFPAPHPSAAAEKAAMDAEPAPQPMHSLFQRYGYTMLFAGVVLVAAAALGGAAWSQRDGPDSAPHRTELARMMEHTGRGKEALNLYTLAGDYGPAYLGRAKAHFRDGDYENAAAYFGKAFEAGAAPEASLLNLALSLQRLGRTSDAIQRYEQFLDAYGEEDTEMAQRAETALSLLRRDQGTLPPEQVGH